MLANCIMLHIYFLHLHSVMCMLSYGLEFLSCLNSGTFGISAIKYMIQCTHEIMQLNARYVPCDLSSFSRERFYWRKWFVLPK